MSILSRLRRLLIVKRKPISSVLIADLHSDNRFLRHRVEQLRERAEKAERRASIAEARLSKFHTKRDARGRYTKGAA